MAPETSPDTSPDTHRKGLLLTLIGILVITPDSLFVRLIHADALTTAFWRAAIPGALVALFVLATQGPGGFAALRRGGWPVVIYIAVLSLVPAGFVLAVRLTSVANVVFIFASMPVFAALYSRLFLGEPFSRRLALTMAAVAVGLAMIAHGSGQSAIGSWRGDLLALGLSAAYAGAMTAARQARAISMVPAMPIAYGLAALALWPLAQPLAAWQAQAPLLIAHGACIAVGTCLLSLGPRYISATEVTLLVLLESVLAPLLVWAVIGEDPGGWALAGGATVIGALLVSNLIALRNRRSRRAGSAP